MPDESVTPALEDWQTCDLLDDSHPSSVMVPLGHVTIFGNLRHKAYEVHDPQHGPYAVHIVGPGAAFERGIADRCRDHDPVRPHEHPVDQCLGPLRVDEQGRQDVRKQHGVLER